MSRARLSVAVDLVAFTIRADGLAFLVQRRERDPFRGSWALPGVSGADDESLEESAARLLVGHEEPYVEQLRTFGDPDRDPRGHVISVAYMAVIPEQRIPPAATFRSARRPPRLAFDHERMLDAGVKRLRAKTEYSTVPLRFLEEPFTLSELQTVYEVLLERPLDKRNFRKKILALEAIEETGGVRRSGAHRPARLFRLAPSRPYLLKERGILFPF